jgi:hypothetical protein
VQQYYERFKKFPVYKEYIYVYTPEQAEKGLQRIFDLYPKTTLMSLAAESDLTPYLIRKFLKGDSSNKRVYDLYIITQIIDNPKFRKAHKTMKKITLLNPYITRKTLRSVGITDKEIFKFLQGQFNEQTVIYNFKSKRKETMTYDVAVGLTACYKYFLKEKAAPKKIKKELVNPNARKRLEYNDRIERYLRGDLSPVQEKS